MTEYGYEESGKWAKLQSLLEERGCTAKLTKDVVTEYLNYNLEYSLDAIYYSGAELLLFSDSADAEKANVYYNDPTEYSKGYRAWRVVMEADETAYNLYKDGKVLFAEGSGGYMMGRAAAQMVKLLLEGQQLGFPNRWRKDFPLQPSGAAECNRNSGTRGAGYQFQPHSGGRNFLMGKSSKIDRI